MKRLLISTVATLVALSGQANAQDGAIIHDAEYYILEAQNGERWAEDDTRIDAKLAALRGANAGKPPNIVYILLDDLGFGEIGSKELSVVRGYDTPAIAKLAQEGLSLQRMYTEPSCTPTRVAMMTGRHPVRTGTMEAKATISGEGLHGDEVTLAEVLKGAGYYTSHVGKWHLGDIQQAFPNEQGFMHAEFPVHQQGQLAIMHADAEVADVIRGVDPSSAAQTFTLDTTFVPNPAHMVTGVEIRDGQMYEIGLEPGETWTQDKYVEMNERYQDNALAQLRKLAAQDKPFFLNYWPLLPSTFTRSDISEFKTLNGGVWAESIVQVDEWVGEILDEIDALGLAENTIVVVMGDNGPFMEYRGLSGGDDRVYRGGKAQHLEGGVRVNAYMRWKGVTEPGSYAEDMLHVTDLFTTFARIAGAKDQIPQDRIIDGLDQSGVVLLGETHGRRDYVFVYEAAVLKSVVKNKYKMHLPAPGTNPIIAPIFDLYRDSREMRAIDSIKYGPWAGGQFVAMVKRHMANRKTYPDREAIVKVPYEGIVNLRPETQEMVEHFLKTPMK
ncbi:sulfatase-like hydrolase/transferase [Shimia sp.]|uniref:sulfatase-like hydrolase/transferase n=1 Tax=Shimia sp. TaxID=1954381 RepID=UPI003298ADE8